MPLVPFGRPNEVRLGKSAARGLYGLRVGWGSAQCGRSEWRSEER